MRVLLTHEIFPPRIHGGGEKVVLEIAKRLQDKGIEIKVLTSGNPKIKEFEGIRTIRLPINRYFMNFAVPWVYKHAKDVDLIQTNNYNACFPSYVAGRLLHKPVVCLVHEVYNKKWIKFRGPIFGYLSRIFERLQVRHDFDRFLFLSEFMRDSAVEIGIPKEKTKVIKPGLGLNFKKFAKIKIKKDPHVLFFGHFIKRKGLEYLLQAAKELPDVTFIIAGRGDEYRKWKNLASKNVSFVRFSKFVSDRELFNLFSSALIFCLPSMGEGFGMAILDAMASGCAIVSTIPLDFEGVRIAPQSSFQIKNAIRYLIDNPDVTIKLGKRNREKAKEYDWDNFIKELIKTYEEVI